jgi:HEAT repeat protein
MAAMEALGAMRYERALQALTDIFRFYGKGAPAEAAFDAIARIAHASSAPLFAEQLAGKNTALRGIAVEGLARVGDATRLASIDRALSGERNDAVVLAGAFATAMLANGPADRIVEALSRPRLHDQAKQYLVELARRRTAAIGAYATDPNATLRVDVADVLGLTDDPAALPVVEALQKDSDARVARAADRAVARLRRDR